MLFTSVNYSQPTYFAPSLPQTAPLSSLLQLGLFALKTPSCSSDSHEGLMNGNAGLDGPTPLKRTSTGNGHGSTNSFAEGSSYSSSGPDGVLPLRVRFTQREDRSASDPGSGTVLSNRLSVLADALRVLHQHIPTGLLYSSHGHHTDHTDAVDSVDRGHEVTITLLSVITVLIAAYTTKPPILIWNMVALSYCLLQLTGRQRH